MNRDQYDQIISAIKDRTAWETKHNAFYTLRHKGIPRVNKPYPGAPNMQSKLSDSIIEKYKPFYVQQLYVNETFCSFVSKKDQANDITTAAANYFDYKLKQESNFERELLIAIDVMLQSGFDVLKVFWDANNKHLCFDACDPLHVIVPDWTEELQDADWLVHVLHYSEAQYKANPNFDHDPDLIRRIKGRGVAESGDTQKQQETAIREGLTHGTDEQIVLWEFYRKENERWVIDTVSPVLSCEEGNQVRATFELPFDHGLLPFSRLNAEIVDKGYYSPRGIPEIVATWEQSISKMLNAKHEWLDHFGNPAYTSEQAIPNAQNFKRRPGSILPPGLKPIPAEAPPVSFDEEINGSRQFAEYRVQMPDFGVVQGNVGARPGGKRTATEVQAIVGQSGQGNDIRARIFRMDLGAIFKMAWSVLLQYRGDEFTYLVNGELQQVPPDALHEEYQIVPNGSPDSWNKGAQIQKALQYYQLLQGNPYIGQDELTKWLIEHDDPRLVKRLYRDPGVSAQQQAEQQHMEILLMQSKFGAQINESDDDKAHCAALAEFFQGKMQEVQSGQAPPPEPIVAQLLGAHAQGHLQALQTKKDPALRQVAATLQPFLIVLMQLAQQAPQNVIPLQPQLPGQTTSQPTGVSPTGGAAASSQPPDPGDKAKTGATILNALSAAIKAGVPISHAEVNGALADMGLPPLPQQPVAMPPPQQPTSSAVGQ